MIVCVCRRVSHRDIEDTVQDGCGSFEELQDELGIARNCGCCHDCAREVFEAAASASAAVTGPVATVRGWTSRPTPSAVRAWLPPCAVPAAA